MGGDETDVLVLGPSTALSRLVVAIAKSRGLRAWRLSLQRIAKGAKISDIIGADGIRVRWELDVGGAARVISPENVRGVFCYGDIPRYFRGDIVSEDIDYVQQEFVSYFGFALSQFRNVINPPFGGSLAGFTDSLPCQWNLVVNSGFDRVSVPHYDIVTRITPLDGIVYSTDFHSYTEWDSASLPVAQERTADSIYLRYERPAGRPCLVWFVDSVFIAIDPLTGDELSLAGEERRRAESLIDVFRGDFDLRLGQLLVFLHGPPDYELTFGSIAPWLSFTQACLQLRRRFASSLLDRLLEA